MAQLGGLGFGAGFLFAAPVSGSGNPAPNPTPQTIGVVQNVKFDIDGAIKELFGSNQYPLDTAVGKRSLKGSFELGQISNVLLSQLFFADAITTGVVATITDPATAIPATPFQITVAEAAHFVADYGVVNAATGIPLVQHATPAAGQYSVNAATGVYTFSSADNVSGVQVLISYSWTDSTAGNTLVAGNHAMGYGPIVALDVVFPYDAPTPGGMGFLFPNVRLGKISVTTKIDDYAMYAVDWEAFAGVGTALGSPFTSYQAF
jgi:hypothetical protein